MKDFAALFTAAVDQSTKTTVKVAAMVEFFARQHSDKLCASPCFPAAAHAA
jgi:hypothetical protein